MKQIKIILILSGFILTCIFNWVSAEEILVDSDLLQRVLQRQDKLEEKIRQLKEQLKKKTEQTKIPAQEEIEYIKEDDEEMSERLDTVETKSIVDKVVLSGEFRTRVNNYNFNDITDNEGKKNDTRTDELWSGRLRINLRSEITKDIIFHGRLSYYKFWGGTNYESTADTPDLYYPGIPDDEGSLHVERAYIDYFIPGAPFSITFGRLPTTDGPPHELRNNTTRKATWPMLCNDGEIDGIISNLSLEKLTGLKKSMFRIGYYKLSQNYQQYKGLDADDSRGGMISFETEIPGLKNSLLWLSGDRIFEISPLTGFVFPANDQSGDSSDAGSMNKYNIHLQFNNIKNSGFSWFGSYVYLDFDKPGNPGGFLKNADNGYAFYLGLNYKLPFKQMKYPILGLEYNYGSEYWIPLTVAGGEHLNKLRVNGSASEFYYIQPVHEKRMFCRAGIIYMDYDHIIDYYGSSDATDMSVLNTYFLVDIRF
ncbi:MAG: DUF3373 family protein [Desulfobacterales bacterium]|nr:DUF3373 family protein [Desulfobacterales bacterium]